MPTNKEYRKHENGEKIMELLSDIIDDCDEAKDNVRYLLKLEETKNILTETRKKLDFIIKSL